MLDLTLPDSVPVGKVKMLIVLSPVQMTPATSLDKSVMRFAGCLAGSAVFASDPVELQKTARNEW